MEAQVMIPALMMGLAGSLHCIGMCGPIAMAIPASREKGIDRLAGSLAYHSGRISTYALFGLLFGLLGKGFSWFAWQQRISVLLGVSILVFLLFPLLFPGKSLHPLISKAMFRVRNQLAQVLLRPSFGAQYSTGLLNGLLPCGLVYMAATGAAITGDPLQGMLFMVLFGLGTFPAMALTTLFGQWLKQPVRIRIRQVYPAIMAVMALLLILRGLNLGIPYISPKLSISSSTAIECHTR